MLRLVICLVLLAGPARSDPPGITGLDMAALQQALPQDVLSRLRDNPKRYFNDALELIVGHGGPLGLGRQDIDRAIDLQRAFVRARELRRMLAADLNGDLVITSLERDALLFASSARMRGTLMLQFRRTDRDADGTLSLTELRADAQAMALASVTEQDAELLRSLIAFDTDRNGYLSLDELISGAQQMGVAL